MLVVFAHLAPVAPRGSGTLVIVGSYQLATPAGPQAGNARSAHTSENASANVASMFLRLAERRWRYRPRPRYLVEGAVIDGVHVQIEELTGEPGDVVIMNPRLLHMVAPKQPSPRMMLLQFLHQRS